MSMYKYTLLWRLKISDHERKTLNVDGVWLDMSGKHQHLVYKSFENQWFKSMNSASL